MAHRLTGPQVRILRSLRDNGHPFYPGIWGASQRGGAARSLQSLAVRGLAHYTDYDTQNIACLHCAVTITQAGLDALADYERGQT